MKTWLGRSCFVKGCFVFGVAAVATLGLAASVDAGWGHSGGSWGSYGSAGASWGSQGSAASYGSWGGWRGWGHRGWASRGSGGSLGGLFHHWRAKRAMSWASHGGGASWGSNGSYGGGYAAASYGASYGSYGGGSYGAASYGGGSYGGSTGGYGGSMVPSSVSPGSAPAPPTPPDGSQVPDIPAPAADAGPAGGSGYLTVRVPAEAKVYVNDRLTRTPGSERTYVSNGLEAGRSYEYEVRAEMVIDGSRVTETKLATLRAGAREALVFDLASPSELQTHLTLHVPADASVKLAGSETRKTGSRREFVTSRLGEGEEWTNYTVQVGVVRNGREITQERSITLRGGESQEMTFDFSDSRLASTR